MLHLTTLLNLKNIYKFTYNYYYYFYVILNNENRLNNLKFFIK